LYSRLENYAGVIDIINSMELDEMELMNRILILNTKLNAQVDCAHFDDAINTQNLLLSLTSENRDVLKPSFDLTELYKPGAYFVKQATLLQLLRRFDEALEVCDTAIRYYEILPDAEGKVEILDMVLRKAVVLKDSNNIDEAEKCFIEAYRLSDEKSKIKAQVELLSLYYDLTGSERDKREELIKQLESNILQSDKGDHLHFRSEYLKTNDSKWDIAAESPELSIKLLLRRDYSKLGEGEQLHKNVNSHRISSGNIMDISHYLVTDKTNPPDSPMHTETIVITDEILTTSSYTVVLKNLPKTPYNWMKTIITIFEDDTRQTRLGSHIQWSVATCISRVVINTNDDDELE